MPLLMDCTIPMPIKKFLTTGEFGLAKVDLVIILDSSTSVRKENYDKMKHFTKDLLVNSDIDGGNVRVGAASFSMRGFINFQLKDYRTKNGVFNAIDKIQYIVGSTNTADAIRLMRVDMFTADNGDRSDVKNIAIVITDGVSNVNAETTIPEAEKARDVGIHIYAIGIGLSNLTELHGIASVPAKDNSLDVQSFDELKGPMKILPSKNPGTIPIPIKKFLTTGEFGLAKVDLVIILDSSTSVREENYDKMKHFTKDLLVNSDIDGGNVRVGAASFSMRGFINFQLKDYRTKNDVFNAIDKIQYIVGSTNTADAIRLMRVDMFTADNGDRPDVKNIAIIITDGVSNVNAETTILEAEKARDVGIHIYAIGIGLSNLTELHGIASVPAKDNSLDVQSFDELKGPMKILPSKSSAQLSTTISYLESTTNALLSNTTSFEESTAD
ncbi:matrilin-1-like, partial [Mytilus galloprovincialis]|uniref:matrilin-1-like n=1 Tax=Mytilus galloprovincialis TaxID=29158 RepID=UPI003F7B7D0E